MSSRTEILRPGRAARLASALGLALLSAGCQDYFARTDKISPGAGDAVAANRAIHVIDPWPPASANATIEVSGVRVARAIERLENRVSGDGPAPGGLAPTIPVVPMAAPGAR